MYKDKAKQREYQRNWVRQKRAKGSTDATLSVEPGVIPFIVDRPEPQSHNSMMVGYVPLENT